MILTSILKKILIANKACIKGTCEGILKEAAKPSWKTWLNSKTVQLKNKIVWTRFNYLTILDLYST